MAEGRDELEWRRWAYWIAAYANAHRSEKDGAIRPEQIGPYATVVASRPKQKTSIRGLAAMIGVSFGELSNGVSK